MYRPWDEDPRPAWRVELSWRVSSMDLEDGDLGRLLRTLDDTGRVRQPVVSVADGALHLSMSIRAKDREAAERWGIHIGEVAYRVTGLLGLGGSIRCSARPHEPVRRNAQ